MVVVVVVETPNTPCKIISIAAHLKGKLRSTIVSDPKWIISHSVLSAAHNFHIDESYYKKTLLLKFTTRNLETFPSTSMLCMHMGGVECVWNKGEMDLPLGSKTFSKAHFA